MDTPALWTSSGRHAVGSRERWQRMTAAWGQWWPKGRPPPGGRAGVVAGSDPGGMSRTEQVGEAKHPPHAMVYPSACLSKRFRGTLANL